MSPSLAHHQGQRRRTEGAGTAGRWLERVRSVTAIAVDHLRHRYAIWITERALQRLDDHLLHDIGIHRGEIRSAARRAIASHGRRSRQRARPRGGA